MSGSFGGKGVNLVRLRDAGFPVPRFVVIATDEYDEFVSRAKLGPTIAAALEGDADAASAQIQAAFRKAQIGGEQRARIEETIGELAAVKVAVRSSATAEDLPDASFAGQQDTYLNVAGTGAILSAVVDCWASLWTPRAIAYRQHNLIGTDSLSLAVVVQEMVQAEVSGVMFTANPLTGNRTETVIDATLGLGEALVSGQVIPDNYLLDAATGRLKEQSLAADRPALDQENLAKLARMGALISAEMGEPQDIEWVAVGHEISVVQSRAITSLYPLPQQTQEPRIWFSFAAVQGVLAPITPLGQDQLGLLACGIGRLFGAQRLALPNPYLQSAGDRLWIRLDGAVKTKFTERLALTLLPLAEPGAAEVMKKLTQEPQFSPGRAMPAPAMLRRVVSGMRRVMGASLGR